MIPVGKVIDLLAAVLAGVVIWYFGGQVLDYLQAPAQLEASRANQAAMAQGVTVQNKAVEGLAAAGDARKERSRAAVNAAGKVPLKHAEDVLAAPAPGSTPLERAANRINEEFGR